MLYLKIVNKIKLNTGDCSPKRNEDSNIQPDWNSWVKRN